MTINASNYSCTFVSINLSKRYVGGCINLHALDFIAFPSNPRSNLFYYEDSFNLVLMLDEHLLYFSRFFSTNISICLDARYSTNRP